MSTYRLRVYVGPTLTRTMAVKFREAGLKTALEGTAHVYVDVPADSDSHAEAQFFDALTRTHGTKFCLTWRDVWVNPLAA